MTEMNDNYPRFFVKCMRRNVGLCNEWSDPPEEHFSEAWLEVPYDVGASGDPVAAMAWIGEELKFEWIPQSTGVICYTQDQVKDLIGDEVYGRS